MNAFVRGIVRQNERPAANLPQTASGGLFRITGGKVQILSIVGEVTTVIQNQANNTKLIFDPAGAGANIDLCAVADIANKAVGTCLSIVGVLATAMKMTSIWCVVPADNIPAPGLFLGPGDILLNCAASNTGQVRWTIMWRPLDLGASVVAL